MIDVNEESKTTPNEVYQEDNPEERKKNSDYLSAQLVRGGGKSSERECVRLRQQLCR